VRNVLDPNRFEAFPGQHATISKLGEPYADLGRVRVLRMQGNMAIAQVELACATISPGDQVMPYAERQQPSYRPPVQFDRFAPPTEKGKGRIVMSKDFDHIIGTGQKVYLNVGGNQGLKVGDYLRVLRNYEPSRLDPADALSYETPLVEDTQKNAPKFPKSRARELPTHAVGEMIVLYVTPVSATAMITAAPEEIYVGDDVETETSPATAQSR
jgi:hypothetical protein